MKKHLAVLVVGVGFFIAACGGDRGSDEATASSTSTTSTTNPTTTTTTSTIAIPAEMKYELFRSTFKQTWESLKTKTAEAFESSIYWIDRIDKNDYNQATNEITFEASVDFESVYEHDHHEWVSDAFELASKFGDYVWKPVSSSPSWAEIGADWNLWTPRLTFRGNGGRLTFSCPGSTIYGIVQRNVGEQDFERACSPRP